MAVLWALGGLLPIIVLIWAAADAGQTLPPLPDSPIVTGPTSLNLQLILPTVLFMPLAYAGAALASRPGAPPIGWVMLVIAACNGVAGVLQQYALHALVLEPGSLVGGDAAAIAASWLPGVSHLLAGTALVLLLPIGRLIADVDRRILRVCLAIGALGLASDLLSPGPLGAFGYLDNPFGVEAFRFTGPIAITEQILFHACVIACAWRVWQVAVTMPENRRLLRRVAALAVVVSVGGGLAFRLQQPQLTFIPAAALLTLLAQVTMFAARKHGIWGMPALLHRSAAWLISTTVLLVAYAGVVGLTVAGVGDLPGGEQFALIAFATLLATLAYSAATRALERRMIGESAEPRAVLLRLLQRLGGATAPEVAAQALADAAARAVRIARVTVELAGGDVNAVAGRPPARPEARTSLPIVHAGTVVGLLAIAVPSEVDLQPAERRTLAAMASLAAPAIHSALLAADIEDGRRRRSQVVAAERNAVDEVLRLELVGTLDDMVDQLGGLDALDPELREATVETLYMRSATMIEQVRQVSRALR